MKCQAQTAAIAPLSSTVRRTHGMEQRSYTLAQSSPEEGLDFACSLLSDAIRARAVARPELSQELLAALTNYVQFRYVGELGLAFEQLAFLGASSDELSRRREQFWAQMRWVATALQLPAAEIERQIPAE